MAFYYVISEVVYNLHIHLAENMLLFLGVSSQLVNLGYIFVMSEAIDNFKLFFHRISCYERVMSYLLKSTFEKTASLPI